jgi:hypothetical protein
MGLAWVQRFRRDPAYIRTNLLADRDNPTRLLTIDFWLSREAWESFREQFDTEFEALDKASPQFTVEEVPLGDFEALEESRPPQA